MKTKGRPLRGSARPAADKKVAKGRRKKKNVPIGRKAGRNVVAGKKNQKRPGGGHAGGGSWRTTRNKPAEEKGFSGSKNPKAQKKSQKCQTNRKRRIF